MWNYSVPNNNSKVSANEITRYLFPWFWSWSYDPMRYCVTTKYGFIPYPDGKVHGTNMGPTWVLSAPAGPHVGPMNLAIRVGSFQSHQMSHDHHGISCSRQIDRFFNSFYRLTPKNTSNLCITVSLSGIYRWPVDSLTKGQLCRKRKGQLCHGVSISYKDWTPFRTPQKGLLLRNTFLCHDLISNLSGYMTR